MEILVCVKDRGTSGVLAIDSAAPKQGDVITAQADGWTWGACELGQVVQVQDENGNWKTHPNGNHNFFRIIKLPNVSQAVVSQLLSREKDVNALNPSPYLQYRGFYLDKTKITGAQAALAAHIADDSRTQPFITVNISSTAFQALISQRTAIPF